jgi:hypothetical protein
VEHARLMDRSTRECSSWTPICLATTSTSDVDK